MTGGPAPDSEHDEQHSLEQSQPPSLLSAPSDPRPPAATTSTSHQSHLPAEAAQPAALARAPQEPVLATRVPLVKRGDVEEEEQAGRSRTTRDEESKNQSARRSVSGKDDEDPPSTIPDKKMKKDKGSSSAIVVSTGEGRFRVVENFDQVIQWRSASRSPPRRLQHEDCTQKGGSTGKTINSTKIHAEVEVLSKDEVEVEPPGLPAAGPPCRTTYRCPDENFVLNKSDYSGILDVREYINSVDHDDVKTTTINANCNKNEEVDAVPLLSPTELLSTTHLFWLGYEMEDEIVEMSNYEFLLARTRIEEVEEIRDQIFSQPLPLENKSTEDSGTSTTSQVRRVEPGVFTRRIPLSEFVAPSARFAELPPREKKLFLVCENRSKLDKIAELFVFGGGKTANQGKKSSEEKKKNKNIKEATTNMAPGREEQSESGAAEVRANQNKARCTSSTTCDTNNSCTPPKTFHAFGNAPIEVLFVDEYLEKQCGGGFYHHLAAPAPRPGRKSIELWQRLQKATWDGYAKKTPGRKGVFSSSSGPVPEKTQYPPPQEYHDYSVENKVKDSLTCGGNRKIDEEVVDCTSAADAEVVLEAGRGSSTTTTTDLASNIKVRKLDRNDGAAGGTGTSTRNDLVLAGAPPIVEIVDNKNNTDGTFVFSVPPPTTTSDSTNPKNSTTSSSGFSTTETTLFNIKKQKFWKSNCTNIKIPTVLWQPNPVFPEYWKLMLEKDFFSAIPTRPTCNIIFGNGTEKERQDELGYNFLLEETPEVDPPERTFLAIDLGCGSGRDCVWLARQFEQMQLYSQLVSDFSKLPASSTSSSTTQMKMKNAVHIIGIDSVPKTVKRACEFAKVHGYYARGHSLSRDDDEDHAQEQIELQSRQRKELLRNIKAPSKAPGQHLCSPRPHVHIEFLLGNIVDLLVACRDSDQSTCSSKKEDKNKEGNPHLASTFLNKGYFHRADLVVVSRTQIVLPREKRIRLVKNLLKNDGTGVVVYHHFVQPCSHPKEGVLEKTELAEDFSGKNGFEILVNREITLPEDGRKLSCFIARKESVKSTSLWSSSFGFAGFA
ncbi:unnamed protein product [Amoebophrya sp. A120]|nr:unnamed protein product [Amoebophrya sp. A120]|eukprot:GSA120T00007431001.1